MDPGHALHIRVTRSPEHYQPLCMPDASTLTCRHACTCVRVYLRMCAFMCCTCRAADSTSTYVKYIRPIHRHRDVYIGWGFVRETAVGFRYDTVDRTARIFGIGALSLGKISAHHRMPEKYFDTVCWCLYIVMHVCIYVYVHMKREYA